MSQANEHDDRDRPSPDWKLPPEPPIHRAARKGDLAALEQLLEEGADINQRADLEFDNGPHLRKLTPLMVAARSIDGATTETLRCFVEHGADIHATSEGGDSAAWYAAGDGARWEFHKRAVTPDHAERLRFLLDQGLDPNERNFIGRSLLTEACEAGDPARVSLLLERGVSVHPASLGSRRPNSMKRLEKSLGAMAELDWADGPTGELDSHQLPLFCAARAGSAECVRLVLDSGAAPDERDSGGATALMAAGSADVVRTLLDAGADLHSTDVYGKDALENILEEDCESGACGPERFHIARALVEAGADIERVDEFGKTRLASAAFGHHDDAVEFLLKLGAEPLAKGTSGGTALHSICWQGEYEDEDVNRACERIITALVRAGVPVDTVDSEGATPLHEAAQGDWGNQTAITALLRFGAAPDPIDNNGDSPLALAAGNHEIECIKLLLEAGADPLQKNKTGRTPGDVAREHLAEWERIVADPVNSAEEIAQEFNDTAKAVMSEIFGDDGAYEPPDLPPSFANYRQKALTEARESLALLEGASGIG